MRSNLFRTVAGIFACLFFAGATSNAVVIPPSPTVTLSWDYPLDQLSTNLTFKVYHSVDVNTPVSQWSVLTNVVGTNLTAKIPMGPGAHFFALTASNAAGESAFATVSP